jgi:RNA polymerase sigma-70 factor (ECF subfamily)
MDPHPQPAPTGPERAQLDRAWREHRRHLLDIGFRMLGSVAAAEDVVQEAYSRLIRADIDEIDDVGGWLVVVVSRLCLDALRADQRHPTTADALLADRVADPALDPADRVTLDDHVRLALHVVLERLTPAERTAFVLHDVFQYSFDAIAAIVGRTPAACRQLASRARRAIASDEGPPRFQIESTEQRRVTEQFIAACTSGDLAGLIAVLDPDVTGGNDTGRGGARGAPAVAANALRYVGPDSGTTLLALPVGGQAGIVVLHGRQVMSLLRFTLRDGRIHHVDVTVDRRRLASVAVVLGL